MMLRSIVPVEVAKQSRHMLVVLTRSDVGRLFDAMAEGSEKVMTYA